MNTSRRDRTASLVGFLLGLCLWNVADPARAWADEGVGEEPPKLEQVIVVFKTHFDIGYTDLARNVVTRYRTSMIDKALSACDASRDLPAEHRFVWTLPGWPMAQILWTGQTPERRKRIEEAIRQLDVAAGEQVQAGFGEGEELPRPAHPMPLVLDGHKVLGLQAGQMVADGHGGDRRGLRQLVHAALAPGSERSQDGLPSRRGHESASPSPRGLPDFSHQRGRYYHPDAAEGRAYIRYL